MERAKTIYQLLNEVSMDWEQEEGKAVLSEREQEQCKQRICQALRKEKGIEAENGISTKKRSGRVWKGIVATAAACIIVVAAAGISNPAFARELYEHLFGRLAQSSVGDKYEQEDQSLFWKLEEHAQKIEDIQSTDRNETGDNASQEKPDFRQSVTNQNATLSVSEAYCDGYILYYTAVLETDNEELAEADGIVLKRPEENPISLTINGSDEVNYVERAFTKEADGRYITAIQVDLMGLGIEREQSERGLVIDWRVGGFTGKRWDAWDEQGNYADSGSITGEWHLTFPVSIDTSGNQVFSIDKEENGILLKRGIQTKAGLVLELELPDLSKEPYQLTSCSVETMVKDSKGERLPYLSEHEKQYEDGSTAKTLMVLYEGQEELLVEVIAKDEKGTVLAEMIFLVPEEERE